MQNPKSFLLSLLLFMSFFIATAAKADVGVILDLDSTLGKILKTCISMAVEDFYSKHRNYSTMIVLHYRDSSSDVVAAASAAVDLLKNAQVMAIIGPQKSIQADFVIDIGYKVRVPIISPATSPVLLPKESPYFIRSAWSSSSQAKAIAAIVKAFGWREVVFIYEDTSYGNALLSFLTEGLQESNALVSCHSAVSPSAEDSQILEQLHNLKSKQMRVFVVHLGLTLASHFFKVTKEAGMMNEGYAWIITDVLTSLLDSDTIEAMQGVLGVKAYIPRSNELEDFTQRWKKRFLKENPNLDRTELNVFGLWAYDSTTALAEAIEHVGVTSSPRFKKLAFNRGNMTDLQVIGTSNTGPLLAHSLRNVRLKGLSGDFDITNGEIKPSAFEIVNVIGRGEITVGFWTEEFGISKKLKSDDHKTVYSTNRKNLLGILWPGQTSDVPKGWEMPASGKKLKVGVPINNGFSELIKVERDLETNAVIATGFCIDVFEEVMRSLPYAIPYEYIPFATPDGQRAGNYNDLIYQIYLEKYDAVVGDVTITAKRSKFVDFTVAYTEPSVATVVPIKDTERKNLWIFMKPLTTGLWLTIGAFFVFTGFVVWFLEHRVNKEFRGPPLQQVGMIFWFSFSTLVFAHREKVISNLTRFVVIVWVFVVMVLTSSYTASLTSMLTVQQLHSTDLIKNGEHVGYQNGSFLNGLFKSMPLGSPKLISYSSLEEFDDALSRGSRNGGVAAIVDETPYIRLLLSKYCHKYTMIGHTYITSGFGFAFRKGSPLVSDVSTAILSLKEDERMKRISSKWFGEEGEGCSGNTGSENLNLDSFKGLFLIAGLSSSSALAIFLSTFIYENRCIFNSTTSIKQKLYQLGTVFNQERSYSSSSSLSSSKESKTADDHGGKVSENPVSNDHEGFLMIELGTIHDLAVMPPHDQDIS